jgi:hypothetical protein
MYDSQLTFLELINASQKTVLPTYKATIVLHVNKRTSVVHYSCVSNIYFF